MTEQPDWTEQARRLVAGLSGMFAGQSPLATPTGAAEPTGDCRWCPLCQAAAVLRGERPELTAAMADVLATAAAALRSFANQAAAAADAAAETAPSPDAPAAGEGVADGAVPPRRPRDDDGVQRIEIA